MSGRPWVKLDSSIYRHPELGLLSDSAWRRFVECIALAGELDRDGALSTVRGTARALMVTEAQLLADIEETGGRLFVDDAGIVRVRDWLECQPPTRKPEPAGASTERWRRAQASKASANGEPTQTLAQPNGAPTSSQEIDIEIDTEKEKEEIFAPSGAATWEAVGARLSGLYGGIGWQSKSGDPLAWAGQCIGLLGKHSHDDPAMAAGLVDAFGASGEVKYAPKPKDLPPVLGKWLANGGSKGAVINV